MATLAELVESEQLVQIGGGLDADEQPERRLYALPHVIDWLENTLPNLETELGDGRLAPMEQVDELFHDFVGNEDFSYYERSHSMNPTDVAVWEFKTSDVRLFGWFAEKGAFVIANADTAFRCKEYGLYAGYRNDVMRRRDLLNLDEPKFVPGGYADVL